MAKIVKRNRNNNNEELRITKHTADSTEACIERIIDGTATLKDLTSIKDNVIDFSKCSRKIKTIQLIYSAGSAVGACTVVAGNMYTLKLTEETMEKFKKSLKMLKENATHVPYKSIWVEEVNKFTFQFIDGHFYDYYVVTNNEIAELEKRIKAMDFNRVTLEELQVLQNDLPPFIRAWQESSIDVSKDKEKVFVKNFDEFFKKIETVSTFLKNSRDDIKSNLQDLKTLHKAGRVNDMSFQINMPTLDPNEVFPDMLGDINFEVKNAVETYFNGGLLDLYKMSNKNYYEQYADACLPYPELAFFMQQIFALTTQAFHEGVKLEKDQYADLRNKIYTKAAAYGVEGPEVVKVAVSVAMRYIKEKTIKNKEGKNEIIIDLGTPNIANYKESKVSRIFPLEYEVLRTNQPVYEKLNIIWMQYGREIPEGEEIEFAAGFSMDDTIELKEMFTGTAININKELMGIVDVYAYTKSNSFISVETFAEGTTMQLKETDEGQFAYDFFMNEEQVIITGRRSNVLVATDKKTLVAKVVPSKEFMPNNIPTVHTIVGIMAFEPNAGQNKICLVTVE